MVNTYFLSHAVHSTRVLETWVSLFNWKCSQIPLSFRKDIAKLSLSSRYSWAELALFIVSPAAGLQNIAYGLHIIADGLHNITDGLHNIADGLHNILEK